jgi:hypothetical protein
MKSLVLILTIFFVIVYNVSGQEKDEDSRILFRGQVMDASTLNPLSNSQIMINNEFSSLSREDGSFSFYVNRYDSVKFNSLGYKPSIMFISDSLAGREYVAGIFMNSDTVSIGEVIIVPGYRNLKYDILNSKPNEPIGMSNARYNVAVSAYQGRNSQNVLGDPQNNYAVISQQQKINAFEKGGIPSDQIAGINPFILLPAAYLLIHGLPAKPPPMSQEVSEGEMEQVYNKYLESIQQKTQH